MKIRKGSRICLTFQTPRDFRDFKRLSWNCAEPLEGGYRITDPARYAALIACFDGVIVEPLQA